MATATSPTQSPTAAKMNAAAIRTYLSGMIFVTADANEDGRHISQHHADGRADGDQHDVVELRRQQRSRDLRLVADLDENAISVFSKMPREERSLAPSSSLSGTRAQAAMAMKARPKNDLEGPEPVSHWAIR